MPSPSDGRFPDRWFVVAVAAVALAAGLTVARTFARGHPLLTQIAVAALVVSALTALVGWLADRDRAARRARQLQDRAAALAAEIEDRDRSLATAQERLDAERGERERERDRLESDVSALRESREELRHEVDRRDAEIQQTRERLHHEIDEARGRADTEQQAAQELRSSREAELRWIAEMRAQIYQLHRERGLLGATDDVPALVLRTAMTLTDAGKGLILGRRGHGAQDFELLASEGFDADPSESAIARRFAGEVIEKDTIVREDDRGDLDRDGRTAADDEIRNLVAVPMYVLDEFTGVVVCANRPGGFEQLHEDVLLALGGQAGASMHHARLQGELRSAYLTTVRVLADAMEAKDGSLRGHGEDVASYAAAVADRLGLAAAEREAVSLGSLLHDVGKIGVSERILAKPGPLSLEEYNVVKLHPRIGHRLVGQVPALDDIAASILHHHERFDGGGYPSGLRGEQIPRSARIVAVADAFSAMTADRPYRARMSVEDACEELERNAGTQFDPEVVRAFVQELRTRPPSGEGEPALAVALGDAEITVQRVGDEPLVGYGAFSLTDNLTMLYSHRYLHEMLRAETDRADVQGTTFSVVLAELTDLARVNAEEGYAAGDGAIASVARVLERVVGRHGGTAARSSGRRLAVVAPVEEPHARRIAAEVRDELAGTVAVAIACATREPGESGDEVLARARRSLAIELPAGAGSAGSD